MHRRRIASKGYKKPVRGRVMDHHTKNSAENSAEKPEKETQIKSTAELVEIKVIRADGTEEIIDLPGDKTNG